MRNIIKQITSIHYTILEQIIMASYYGWKFRISTMITSGCNNICRILLTTQTNGYHETSQSITKTHERTWNDANL